MRTVPLLPLLHLQQPLLVLLPNLVVSEQVERAANLAMRQFGSGQGPAAGIRAAAGCPSDAGEVPCSQPADRCHVPRHCGGRGGAAFGCPQYRWLGSRLRTPLMAVPGPVYSRASTAPHLITAIRAVGQPSVRDWCAAAATDHLALDGHHGPEHESYRPELGQRIATPVARNARRMVAASRPYLAQLRQRPALTVQCGCCRYLRWQQSSPAQLYPMPSAQSSDSKAVDAKALDQLCDFCHAKPALVLPGPLLA
jgi:hypothetical protein